MKQTLGALILFAGLLAMFQNCGANMRFEEAKLGKLGVCNGISCDLTPLTFKPAVTTILLALGDEADDQLVVKGASSQLIAETVIRYTSPISNPRILLVRDSNAGSEDPEDTHYVQYELLARYNVTYMEAPPSGLSLYDVEGYDIIWLNNPGAPMGSKNTRDTLLSFEGGVVLQGDDLSYGTNFDNEELTGLKYINNGTSVTCDGVGYNHNDNTGYQYRVTADASKIPGADSSTINFKYGNDIDLTVATRADLEVLATAKGGPESCTESRPVIVRYQK